MALLKIDLFSLHSAAMRLKEIHFCRALTSSVTLLIFKFKKFLVRNIRA